MKNTKLAIVVAFALIAIHTKAQDWQTERTAASGPQSKLPIVNAPAQKPNIIFILADDVGYKSLTCDGGNLYSTPNIDKLVQKGMRFTQCHASSGCSPSRFMLLTGKYNFRNYTKWGVMDRNQKTIANMFKDAGYKTACYGKWQLDGGDISIKAFGFDNYAIHDPYEVAQAAGSKYKNPHIYTNGGFLPDSLTLNKYGPDVSSDSLLSFIEANKSNPFFIYYPMILVHNPFSPTPDDVEFTDWSTGNSPDTSYFSSMMHYMDKKIGELITKIKSLGIENNTIIIFSGDNGTPSGVPDYTDDDTAVLGGKHSLTEAGTHVPLIVYWPGTINPGTVNSDLIDFTDFLPTLAGIANITVPNNYGPLDGVSFSSRLTGQTGIPRNWIFNYIDRHPGEDVARRWAQTKAYKLYDTSSSNQSRLFYNIKNDPNEKFPIADTSLTAQESIIKQQLWDVIRNYVAQGTPIISLHPSLSLIRDSSVVLQDTINTNGGSTVTASGAVWSINPDPELSSCRYTSTGKIWGPFSTLIKGLNANTTYYVRAYAINFADTVYSDQITFKTLLAAPVATAATAIDTDKFTTNWNTYTGPTHYKLDVSTSSTFSKMGNSNLTQGFNNGITPPTGWTISKNIIADTIAFGIASPSLEFKVLGTQVITKQLGGKAMELSFWIKGLNTNHHSSLLIEGFDGIDWKVITNLNNIPTTGITEIFNSNSNPPLEQNFIQFRFTFTNRPGTLAFDDISIKYKKPVPFFIPGYNNLVVKTNSKAVTGLKAATNYYYRVRAVKGSATSGNSNVITVITHKGASITHITKPYQAGMAMDSNYISIAKNNRLNVRVFPNPSQDEFILTLQTIKNEKPEITVTDMKGKEICRVTSSGNNKYIFGKTFPPGVYVVRVVQEENIQTVKVIKGE